MGKGNALPDSLELLLDTMCNTFGGIVFIAISLTIISQMATKDILDSIAKQSPEQKLEQAKQTIKDLEKSILEKRKELLDKQLAAAENSSQEKRQIIRELNAKTKRIIEQDNEIITIKLQKNDADKKLEATLQKLTQEQIKGKTEAIKGRLKVEELLRDKVSAKQKMERLQKQKTSTKGYHLTFALQKQTSKTPFWVFLKDHRLYRYYSGTEDLDVIDKDTEIHFNFLKGHSITRASDADLAQLFNMVSYNSKFISIASDETSFKELVRIRRFMRSQGFMVNWLITDNYTLYRSENVDYTASE